RWSWVKPRSEQVDEALRQSARPSTERGPPADSRSISTRREAALAPEQAVPPRRPDPYSRRHPPLAEIDHGPDLSPPFRRRDALPLRRQGTRHQRSPGAAVLPQRPAGRDRRPAAGDGPRAGRAATPAARSGGGRTRLLKRRPPPFPPASS